MHVYWPFYTVHKPNDREDLCSSCFDSTKLNVLAWSQAGSYSLVEVHKPHLYAVSAVFKGKQWDCVGLESRQFGSVLRVMFSRENNKMNGSWSNRRQQRTGRGTAMFLWEEPIIKGKPDSRLFFGCLMLTTSGRSRLLLPSLMTITRKTVSSFPQCLSRFFLPVWSAITSITAVYDIVIITFAIEYVRLN